MATTLRTPSLLLPSLSLRTKSLEAPRSLPCLSTRQRSPCRPQLRLSRPSGKNHRFSAFRPLSAMGETAEAGEVEVEQRSTEEGSDSEISSESASDDDIKGTEEKETSVLMAALQSYKEALSNDDQSTVADIEGFLQSIEDEKNSLANKVTALTVELTAERDRVLRIGADFDNFRKRTERERLSLMTNVQGEVVESLLPVLDNFERAKTQIKVETEGEEKINGSYQSIYKQFEEILTSLGVEAVETVGQPFDPLLHEAIMQEETIEFEEGVIIQEFRKGFKLGERLLRPSMVKVSSGPGPAKPETGEAGDGENGEASQASTEGAGDPA